MAMINILQLETPIVEVLETISGVDHVYVEADSEELTADSIDEPVISIANAGYVINRGVAAEDIVGCTSAQVLTSQWMIAVICKKEDYLTKASIIQMEIINKLKGFRAKGWRYRMRVGTDVRNYSRPDIDVRVSYYPMMFVVDVII